MESFKDSLSRDELLGIADEAVRELEARAPSDFPITELLVLEAVDRLIFRRLRLPAYAEWRREGRIDLLRTPLLPQQGSKLAKPLHEQVLVSVATVSQDLLRALARNPEQLFALSPRKFEELIAELLHRQGFSCELTPVSNDGGKDIVASLETGVGSFVVYVECKRFGQEHRVGARLARELLGVVTHGRVTAGLLVTTSAFTRGAKQLQHSNPHRLGLRDYQHVRDWLLRYGPHS